jgi:hypothetical protein
MAKAKNPLLSMEARGALGGIEFRASTYGNIVGRRSISPHGRSEYQLMRRAQFTAASTAWLALSPRVKSLWNSAAPQGSSGRSFFISGTMRLSLYTYPPDIETPYPDADNPLKNFRLTYVDPDYPGFQVDWDTGPIPLCAVTLSVLATFSHRSAPTHARGTVLLTTDALVGAAFIRTEFKAPVVHVWASTIKYSTGELYETQLFRFEPNWS